MQVPETDTEPDDSERSIDRWSLLGLSGTVSLCCLFAAPAASSAAVAGGTAAAAGGGVVRVVVTALTVAVVGAVSRYRREPCDCSD